jgi:hypothetical protein
MNLPMRKLIILFTFSLVPVALFPQSGGFFDDFEDGSVDTLWDGSLHTLWKADHPGTFGITETGGYLNIAYTRTAESAEWDNFNFTPPELIDVSNNPVISLKIKSDVATTFTVKPIYTNGNSGWLQKEVPADLSWHHYTYELLESNYDGGTLEKIYLYFDGGSTQEKSGMVQFDDFQIAGFSISVNNLQAHLIDSSRIELKWETNDPGNTDHFNIYRSEEMEFTENELTRISETTETIFQDTGLANHTTYYYKVSATDTDGREHAPAEVSLRTSSPGSVPSIEIVSVNADPVARYDKFEVVVNLLNASYVNPFDPDEIDLYAWFYSPGGDSVKMNGFYDNYQGRDQWKIRFAANQAGSWNYTVFATDPDGTGKSENHSFSVVESTHKGWLHISPDNSNYLMHDDGSSFYGVSVYYPWSVNENGLDDFAAVKGNFFGYWDCTFDYAGNGGGRYLLESMESGLGRIDQRKAARIDEVLTWAEAREMNVMLAMWTHPYLRIDGVPWDDGLWLEQNPYSSIVEPEDFYTDSLAWSYQEKHYRYMIARWGYSRALGIWEIINEIHGTTGWVRDQAASKKWVERVHGYLKENDPFRRPTTASFGGGDGASHYTGTDQLGDMPNVHFYELHGWPNPYPDNVVRSGLANVVSESRKLKSKGDRPAFFGEAGYSNMLAAPETEAYTWEMHDSFWAGLTNGLASTPFWWEFNSTEIITAERLQNYLSLYNFVSDIDFAHQLLKPVDIWVENIDGYFMGADSTGFGWMKSYEENSVSNAPFYISGTELDNGNYTLEWVDTWTGEVADVGSAICVEGVTWGEVPAAADGQDVAFKLHHLESGMPAVDVNLYLVKSDTLVPGPQPWSPKVDSTINRIACYVTDDEHRMDTSFNGPVEITIEGEGQPGPFTLNLKQGGVVFETHRVGPSGATITATVEGLGSASLDMEGVTGTGGNAELELSREFLLKNNYPNPFDQFTTIEYVLPRSVHITLAVYNAQGRLLETLVDGQVSPGQHSAVWNAGSYPAGLYFYTMRSEKFSITRKCMLSR